MSSEYRLPDELRDSLVRELNKFVDNMEPESVRVAFGKPVPEMFRKVDFSDPLRQVPRDYEGYIGVMVRFKHKESK